MKYLKEWKRKSNRKPLIIRGARQTGKTWLMKEFGRVEYEKTAYINFESSGFLKNLFIEDFDINRILTALKIETGIQIEPENTLIIFDEIQDADGAITSLKYFCENAPEYHIIAAGSSLGITLHKNVSFPVGKVEFKDLHPLSFFEFLLAMNQKPLLDLIYLKDWSLIKSFKNKYVNLLREYFYTGGMPEVVLSFKEKGDFAEVRRLQKQILLAYEQDFSKHAPFDIVPRIRMLWDSIPSQLAKENKKFIYRLIKKGARAKEYEMALSWLKDSGLVHKITRVSKPGIPLKAYEDFSAFKLFIVDTGLLVAIGDIDAKVLLNGNKIFEEFKGAVAEQYVLQQLLDIDDIALHYWSSERSAAEVDFIIQMGGDIIPVEVKAEENLQAKSLKVFSEKYNSSVSVRTSMSDFRKESWLVNIPLYAIGNINNIIAEV